MQLIFCVPFPTQEHENHSSRLFAYRDRVKMHSIIFWSVQDSTRLAAAGSLAVPEECKHLDNPSTIQFTGSWYLSPKTEEMHSRSDISQPPHGMALHLLHPTMGPHHPPQVRRRPIDTLHPAWLALWRLCNRQHSHPAFQCSGDGLLQDK